LRLPAAAVLRGASLRGQLHDLLLRGAGGQDAGEPALAHDGDAMAQPQYLRQLGGDDDDGAALRGQRVEQVVDLGLGADVDARVGSSKISTSRRSAAICDDHLLLVAAESAAPLPSDGVLMASWRI